MLYSFRIIYIDTFEKCTIYDINLLTSLRDLTLQAYFLRETTTEDWFDRMVFYVPLKIFHLYGAVIISGEWLQNRGLSSTVTAFEQEGIFIVPHLLCPKEHTPHLIVLYDKQEDLF